MARLEVARADGVPLCRLPMWWRKVDLRGNYCFAYYLLSISLVTLLSIPQDRGV